MAVDRRRDRLDDSLANTIIPSKGTYFFFVLLREAESSKLILLLVDVIGLDDGREYGETVLRV